jgi:hypothetical protein
MLYAPLTSPMRVTCPAHFILLALITLTILGEMRGENFVAHLDGLGDTPVYRGTPVAHHC